MLLKNDHPERNLGAVGETGSGKTWLLISYILACYSVGIMPWIFTNKLDDALRLSRMFNPPALIFQLMHGYHQKFPTFKFNPFMPPENVSFRYWLGIAANVLGSVSKYLSGGIRFMRIRFERFAEHLEKAKKEAFTAGELYDFYIKQSPNSQFGEREKFNRTVESQEDLINFMGKENAYSVVRGYDLLELSNHCVIFVMPNIPNPIKEFMAGMLYMHMAEVRDKNPKLSRHKQLFAVEEAHDLFPLKTDSSEIPVLCDCCRYGRFVGLCLAFTSHTTHLHDLILGNLYTYVFKQLSNPDHHSFVRKVCSFNNEQMQDYLLNFGVENAIVKMSGHPAYKIDCPDIALPELDCDLNDLYASNMERIMGLSRQPQVLEKGMEKGRIHSFSSGLTNLQIDILLYVAQCESRGNYIGMTRKRTYQNFKKVPWDVVEHEITSLEAGDWLHMQNFKYTPGPGRGGTIAHLKTKGCLFAKNHGITLRADRNNKSIAHEAAQFAVWSFYHSKRYETVQREKYVEGLDHRKYRVDVFVQRSSAEKSSLYEVVFSNPEIEVVNKIFNTDFSKYEELVLVYPSDNQIRTIGPKIRRKVNNNELMKKVRFEPLSRYGSIWTSESETKPKPKINPKPNKFHARKAR